MAIGLTIELETNISRLNSFNHVVPTKKKHLNDFFWHLSCIFFFHETLIEAIRNFFLVYSQLLPLGPLPLGLVVERTAANKKNKKKNT